MTFLSPFPVSSAAGRGEGGNPRLLCVALACYPDIVGQHDFMCANTVVISPNGIKLQSKSLGGGLDITCFPF